MDPLALAIGVVAVVVGVIATQFRARKHIIPTFVVMSLCWSGHYAVLHQPVAAGVHAVTAVRLATAATFPNCWIAFGFMAGYVMLDAILWKSAWDILPVAATVTSTAAVFWLDGISLRIGLTMTAVLFLTFNVLHAHSLPGATFSIFMIGSNLVALARHHRHEILRSLGVTPETGRTNDE